jgi:DNA anti-recombination protein RmuC
MELWQILLVIVGMLGSVIGFLAGLVSVLLMSRVSSIERKQDEMKNDWMGRSEINPMVRRVQEDYNARHDHLEEKQEELTEKYTELKESMEDRLDAMAGEFSGNVERVNTSLKREMGNCANRIIQQVLLAMRVHAGDPIKAGDILTASAEAKREP